MNMVELKRKHLRDFIALYRTINPKNRDEGMWKLEFRLHLNAYRAAKRFA